MIALLVILCVLGVLCVGLLAFILLTLQSQIEAHTPRLINAPPPDWPIIPESVRVDRVPAVQRKPRKPRAKKQAEPAAEPATDTQTLPLPGVTDEKPTV